MDLTTLKRNLSKGRIRTMAQFQRDLMLMFQNAVMYNDSDHHVYHMAVEMQREVLEQIQVLYVDSYKKNKYNLWNQILQSMRIRVDDVEVFPEFMFRDDSRLTFYLLVWKILSLSRTSFNSEVLKGSQESYNGNGSSRCKNLKLEG